MGRPRLPAGQRRIQRTIRVPPEMLEWIQQQVRELRFKDETHAFEYAMFRLMKEEDPDTDE